mmetsp:Transcript_45581/g.117830  ORF Transcript_45581/g.117830 Transcript_45581/m.117830 type:complete len:245 (-) Transcript_45581:42-776(-)
MPSRIRCLMQQHPCSLVIFPFWWSDATSSSFLHLVCHTLDLCLSPCLLCVVEERHFSPSPSLFLSLPPLLVLVLSLSPSAPALSPFLALSRDHAIPGPFLSPSLSAWRHDRVSGEPPFLGGAPSRALFRFDRRAPQLLRADRPPSAPPLVRDGRFPFGVHHLLQHWSAMVPQVVLFLRVHHPRHFSVCLCHDPFLDEGSFHDCASSSLLACRHRDSTLLHHSSHLSVVVPYQGASCQAPCPYLG